MSKNEDHRKVVGIYDRPASADRRWPRRVALVVALVIAIAWTVYLLNA